MAILTKPLNGRAAMPLLRAVRPRMHQRFEFQLQPGDDSAGREHWTIDPDHRCDGARNYRRKRWQGEAVSYVDKATRTEKRMYAKAFVVAASACESARLLLNSQSALFPDGLANSSGVVGRYFTDIVGSSGGGFFPQLEKMPPHNHDGVGGMHMYMPWWKFDRKNDFLRGYHIEVGGGRDMPGVGEFDGLCEEYEGYGAQPETKMPQHLWHVHRIRRPWRNDS